MVEQAMAIINVELKAMESQGPDVMADPNTGLAAVLNGGGAEPNRSTSV